MQINYPRVSEIKITDRQRQEYDTESIVALADSIVKLGLIHPIVLKTPRQLVAGGRRIKAIEWIYLQGSEFRCAGAAVPAGCIPATFIDEMDPVDVFEVELDENIKRTDLTWQERSKACADLLRLRTMQAERAGSPPPSIAEVASESHAGLPEYSGDFRASVLISKHLSDPDISSATSTKEALKILKRKEATRRNTEHAAAIGDSLITSHRLYNKDSIYWMQDQNPDQFDVILTDPPYGIAADEFSDSGGRAAGAHFYDDSHENWVQCVSALAYEGFRLCKPQAHAYVFCDIEHFIQLRGLFQNSGWRPFRTPIIWHKPSGMRAPWPEHGPQRKYEVILYANKGNRPVTRLYPDLIAYPPDPNLGHQAQKPVALFQDLLIRSIRPGDAVLDPFCGTGPIFEAAQALKCVATGIEIDPAAYGIAAKRMEGLK